MSIRSVETSLALGPAPEFAHDDGLPPTVTTPWVPLRWELFAAKTDAMDGMAAYALLQLFREHRRASGGPDPLLSEDGLDDDSFCQGIYSRGSAALTARNDDRLKCWVEAGGKELSDDFILAEDLTHKPWSYLTGRVGPRPYGATICNEELRRLVHSVRWRRRDPVTQLPPGTTREETHSLTTGLSVEKSQMLSHSLGVDLKGNAANIQTKLSYRLEQQFGFKLEINKQEERVFKNTISNPANDRYRLYAMWHVEQRIAVHALSLPVSQTRTYGLQPTWIERTRVEFVSEGDLVMSYIERPIVGR